MIAEVTTLDGESNPRNLRSRTQTEGSSAIRWRPGPVARPADRVSSGVQGERACGEGTGVSADREARRGEQTVLRIVDHALISPATRRASVLRRRQLEVQP